MPRRFLLARPPGGDKGIEPNSFQCRTSITLSQLGNRVDMRSFISQRQLRICRNKKIRSARKGTVLGWIICNGEKSCSRNTRAQILQVTMTNERLNVYRLFACRCYLRRLATRPECTSPPTATMMISVPPARTTAATGTAFGRRPHRPTAARCPRCLPRARRAKARGASRGSTAPPDTGRYST